MKTMTAVNTNSTIFLHGNPFTAVDCLNTLRKAVFTYNARTGFRLSDSDCEDVIQESYIKVHNSISRYDSEKSRPDTWVSRIAVNTASSYACAKKRERVRMASINDAEKDGAVSGRNVFLDDGNEADYRIILGEDESISAARCERVRLAIEQLSSRDKFVIVMFMDGKNGASIASALGVKPGTARTMLSRAKGRLADIFQSMRIKDVA